MKNLRCKKCGKFIGKYFVATDPATGVTRVSTPSHRCLVNKGLNGKFTSVEKVEKERRDPNALNVVWRTSVIGIDPRDLDTHGYQII